MGSSVITRTPALSSVQSPPKGVTIPYRPKPSGSPVIFAGGQVGHDTESCSFRETLGFNYFLTCLLFWILEFTMHICAEYYMLRNL